MLAAKYARRIFHINGSSSPNILTNIHTYAHRVFPCATPAEVRASLPPGADVVAFQCRNPIHRAHYELFTRAQHAPNVRPGAVVLLHATMGPTQVCGRHDKHTRLIAWGWHVNCTSV